MRLDIYKVTQGKEVYLGFKYFETRPNKGDTICFGIHDYKVLDTDEYSLWVKLIN